ncbi:MAG: hypothetical protein E7591_08280 [Ruminococcaceae bacterium]|nr:hypothetical protein [Oscillospiraceae bacterium]
MKRKVIALFLTVLMLFTGITGVLNVGSFADNEVESTLVPEETVKTEGANGENTVVTAENEVVFMPEEGNVNSYAMAPRSRATSNEALLSAKEVLYTVDFVYNGITYSIPGESSLLMTELFAKIGIYAAAEEIVSVHFTNYDYLSFEKEGADYRITSLAPFLSEELLTVDFTDGTVAYIYVYDSSPIISEAAGNFCILYYTTQKDPAGNDVTGIYWYSNTESAYIPVAYWGAPTTDYEYICTTIEQALEWACLNIGLGALNGGNVQGIRIYITEMYHVPTDGEIWGQSYFTAHWPGFAFVPTQVLRAPGYSDEMIHIHTGFDKHLYVQNNVLIDNASAHCPDNPNPVAIRVADGGLMIADGCIIMDTTIPTDTVNKTGYKGTGVLLTTMNPEDKVYPMVELNGGALELVGNTQIHHFAMAVDSDYGVTRLREPNPTLGTWNIDNNVLSVNLAYGTYLGKWCSNINQINNVSVFLEDVEKWSSGDIILASGYKTNPVLGQPDIKTPVVQSDRNKIVIQNEMDLSYSMAVSYYGGITSDPYPVIRFEIASVYNIQLNKWYFTLYEAVADSRNNDELVFYNSTNEGYTVYIPHNLTIRSSYAGEKPGGKSDSRAGSNCTATWNSKIINAVIVGLNTNPTNNMVVKFGTNDTSEQYGELTFDTNNKCRHLENYGYAYLYSNLTFIRGNCEYGGSICNVGFTYLDGAEIVNCTAGAKGQGGAVAVTNGAFYFRSGLIDNCSANEGGAIYNGVNGTAEFTGGIISNCNANFGGAVYQNGIMFGVGGSVRFTKNGGSEDIYLPSTATKDTASGSCVITKLSDFDFGTNNRVKITLGNSDANYYDGRNVVISGTGTVVNSDLAKFTLTNTSGFNKDLFETFKFVYTAKDTTPGNKDKSVLELDITLTVKLGDLTITKKVVKNNGVPDEDQAFIFDVVGTSANNSSVSMTVIIYGNGSVTIKDLPEGNYKVTERTDWSWRYARNSVTVSVNGATAVKAYTRTVAVSNTKPATIAFTNTLTNKQWLSDTCYAVNKFKEV